MEETTKENDKDVVDQKMKIGVIVGAVVLVVIFLVVLVIASSASRESQYEVLVEGMSDVQCEGTKQVTCEGNVTLPARLNANAETAAATLEVVATGGDLASGAGEIPSLKIAQSEYAELKTAQEFTGDTKIVAKLKRDNQKTVTYRAKVTYTLSDTDRQLLADLDTAYQNEQEIKRQEEERKRLEAEKREQERQKEAAAAERDKQNKAKMQTTAHIVCKRYMENYFFPLKVKVHSIMGVAYDKAMNDYSWGYGVNITVSSSAGGELKYTAACVAGNFSSDYESASVIDFAVQSGWK